MVSGHATEEHTDVRFRLRNVQAGAAISTVAASAFLLYELLTWDRPNRGLVAALYVLTIALSAVLSQLNLEPVMRHPIPRESFFVAWSAIIVALISAGLITDGGASSPLVVGLVLPLVFAALSYPLGSMVAVGVMVVGAYLAIALGMGGIDTPAVCFVSLALTCATWMCAWQARNHDLQRRELGRVAPRSRHGSTGWRRSPPGSATRTSTSTAPAIRTACAATTSPWSRASCSSPTPSMP